MLELRETLKEILSIEGVRYFYHYTNKDGNELLERGILLKKKNIHEIAFELDENDKENILNLLSESYNRAKFEKEKGNVVIIACDENCEIMPIKDTILDDFDNSKEYIICPEFLIININVITGEFSLNDRSLLLGDMYTL